jgi:hypothetical protein
MFIAIRRAGDLVIQQESFSAPGIASSAEKDSS